MKAMIALMLLLTLDATARAMPVPVEGQAVAVSLNDSALTEASAINIGAAGVTREQDYFRAPQTPLAAGRIFPCRLQLRVFEKTRLAQSCN